MPAETAKPAILDRMTLLGDASRCRLLLALGSHELSVSELCAALQLPQSTISRHLKLLATGGWVEARRDGTRRLYSTREPGDDATRRLWELVAEQIAAGPTAAEDRRRLAAVLARRGSRSRAFFSSAAARWAETRRELFGHRFDGHALLALLDPRWTVADLGSGTGQVAASLAPHVARVIAVDDSAEMLSAAATRLAGLDNVELRPGSLERLPIGAGELDAAVMVLVLHHVAEPAEVLGQAARTLKKGGRLVVVDMLPHDREDLRRDMGHVWLGFDREQLSRWLHEAGFGAIRFTALPAEPDAKGPSLFAASAVAATSGSRGERELATTAALAD